jgi:hypothetical protein
VAVSNRPQSVRLPQVNQRACSVVNRRFLDRSRTWTVHGSTRLPGHSHGGIIGAHFSQDRRHCWQNSAHRPTLLSARAPKSWRSHPEPASNAVDRGQCISDAAHGIGLCYACGPMAEPGSTQQLCGSACIDMSADPANCGGCGMSCASYQACQAGACVGCDPSISCAAPFERNPDTCACVCPVGLTECDGGCVDTTSNAAHCGGCGESCGPHATCANGACACWAGYSYCEAQGQCVSNYCGVQTGERKQYNPDTCQCECIPPYVPIINTGYCATACDVDEDCPGTQVCRTTTEGAHLCSGCGQSEVCTDCTTSASCHPCGANTYCAEGICFNAC